MNTLPSSLLAKLPPSNTLSLCHFAALEKAHSLPFPPDSPVLLYGPWSAPQQETLPRLLALVYPAAHPLTWYPAAQTFPLENWQNPPDDEEQQALYLPALETGHSLESFQEIIAHLRAPEDGCPWDKKQTHHSLRKYLLEETYEALDALDASDTEKIREELGDLLLQIVLHAQIGVETGEFTLAQILKTVHDKIVYRHPHVFGQTQVDGVEQVLTNWETLKQAERAQKGEEQKGMLDGLPLALPSLTLAQELQDRAARVGFDWPDIGGVMEKALEEWQEVQRAETSENVREEIGDLLFVLVNFARWKKVDAETALREANQKFRRRFSHMEQAARSQRRELKSLTLAEWDELWERAKHALRE